MPLQNHQRQDRFREAASTTYNCTITLTGAGIGYLASLAVFKDQGEDRAQNAITVAESKITYLEQEQKESGSDYATIVPSANFELNGGSVKMIKTVPYEKLIAEQRQIITEKQQPYALSTHDFTGAMIPAILVGAGTVFVNYMVGSTPKFCDNIADYFYRQAAGREEKRQARLEEKKKNRANTLEHNF